MCLSHRMTDAFAKVPTNPRMAENTLIIFVKNPIAGTVKTRIARTVGNERAVEVYQHLLRHTQAITRPLTCRRVVYYGDFINPDDGWNGYEKQLQSGRNLGERMREAFREQLESSKQVHPDRVNPDRVNPDRVVIIGSDCLGITPGHIEQAFLALDKVDVVIGPATDGGYYLLGMKKLHSFLFDNMPWSQPELRHQTEQALLEHGLVFERLEQLTDIDEWVDYENALI
ncbi:MAG: glycosyltransferase [Spirosoma sp.]|nr:glycosyltransferase [Spirosoma sp.]